MSSRVSNIVAYVLKTVVLIIPDKMGHNKMKPVKFPRRMFSSAFSSGA